MNMVECCFDWVVKSRLKILVKRRKKWIKYMLRFLHYLRHSNIVSNYRYVTFKEVKKASSKRILVHVQRQKTTNCSEKYFILTILSTTGTKNCFHAETDFAETISSWTWSPWGRKGVVFGWNQSQSLDEPGGLRYGGKFLITTKKNILIIIKNWLW